MLSLPESGSSYYMLIFVFKVFSLVCFLYTVNNLINALGVLIFEIFRGAFIGVYLQLQFEILRGAFIGEER